MKIVSLNVEFGKHYDKTREFLKRTDADVFCFQEVAEVQFEEFARWLGSIGCFEERSLISVDHFQEYVQPLREGNAIFSKTPLLDCETYELYEWGRDIVDRYVNHTHVSDYLKWKLQMVRVAVQGEEYVVGNVHLPPAPTDDIINDDQREALDNLLKVLEQYDEFVLCGDFNSPRGRIIFDTVAEHYKDNIPAKYATSIDVSLHKNGAKDPEGLSKVMVDGLFTTPRYQASCVELVPDVSDHMAVVGYIEKAA